MRTFTRRDLLRYAALLSALVPARWLLGAPTGEGDPQADLASLGPFLDTLLPGDTTPSATQLGVGQSLLVRAEGSRQLLRLLTLGCAWLDTRAAEQGAAGFGSLDAQGRITVVQAAEESPLRSLPRVFFEQVRGMAFHIYYARPEVWPSLGYDGPPQPRGFPDHARPPKAVNS